MAHYRVGFYLEGQTSFVKNGPGILSYEASRDQGYDSWGNPLVGHFTTTISLTPGKMATVDVMGRATGNLVTYAYSGGEIVYALRIAPKDPAAPSNVPIPVLLKGRCDVSVTSPPGGTGAPTAWASLLFRHPQSPYYESLLSVSANSGHRQDSNTFEGLRALPVGQTGFLRIGAAGEGGGEWQSIADPIVVIDPTAMVNVNGVEVPATSLYQIEMSDGFLPANGVPFRWINPAGGDFTEAENWRTFDGPAVPQGDADVEFVSLQGGRAFTITLDGPRSVAGISVQDADVALDLAGHGLDNFGQLVVGQVGPDRGLLEIQNGTLAVAGGVKMGMTAGVEGVLQIDAGATLDTTRVALNSYAEDMPGSGTLVLAGGTIRADEVVVYGPRSTLAFHSGTMILDGGNSSFCSGSPVVVGNGTDAANLTILSGYASFSSGLALADGAALELRGGTLYTPSFSAAPGSAVAWSGGEWICGAPLSLGADDPLGADLELDGDMVLRAQAGLHVRSSGRLLVDGGTLVAQTLTYDAGAGLAYAGGYVEIYNGDITLGTSGFTGPGGSQAVTLTRANDQLATGSGAVVVDEGFSLHLAAGGVHAAGLVVNGTFDYGGLAPDEPGQGRLGLYFNGPEPGCLRIGAGGGDAVINGRTIVKVGPEGGIYVYGGSLRIDPGYELHLLGPKAPDDNANASANRIELAGTIVLEEGKLETGELAIEQTGCLSGNGIVGYNVENGGLVSPGLSPGAIQIWGNYNQTSEGKLVIEIASPTEFDALLVSGDAHLAGTLEIVLRDGFVPGPGQSFDLITAGYLDGEFDQVIVDGGDLNVAYSPGGFVVSGVPEPSTLAMLAGLLAVASAAIARRRNR
ncbi:MAG: PEP-CTERM sorting domain-containing protein [Pirellulales bacterium]|nr:PEP-CTERM sorting domain-containing protein [Pirellulales bacterium]